MAPPQDYLTKAEAQRLKHIASDLADLRRMKKALNAEQARIARRGVTRLETATRQRRRAAEQAEMYETRFEGTV